MWRVSHRASVPSSLNFGVEPLQFHAGVFDAELPATPILSLEVPLAPASRRDARRSGSVALEPATAWRMCMELAYPSLDELLAWRAALTAQAHAEDDARSQREARL